MFQEIVVGVDGSELSFEVLRLAVQLRARGGALLSLTIAETHWAGHTGFEAPEAMEEILESARATCRNAEAMLAGDDRANAMVAEGRAGSALLNWATTNNADLIAVGSHSHSRAAGVLFGSVATRTLHDAPCSVLIGRVKDASSAPIAAVTVGTDGSEPAAAAEQVAEQICESAGAHLRRLMAEDSPVDALVQAGETSDLLVLGSRGLHGVKALGSVAERVAHQASCSVLVVRATH
jgi:nucleotide-binding universal stress UspA family protein